MLKYTSELLTISHQNFLGVTSPCIKIQHGIRARCVEFKF
jgi:hypothetical protein